MSKAAPVCNLQGSGGAGGIVGMWGMWMGDEDGVVDGG